MKIKTVEDAFDSYLKDVIPETARAAQVRETKRAFYAGAGVMFGLMVNNADDMEKTQELFNEVKHFIELEAKR